jgi:hypothetical protein
MNLSNDSKKIIQYFTNHTCFYSLPTFTKKTLSFLSLFYSYFQKAEEYIKNKSITIKKIDSMPYPQTFSNDSIDKDVLKKINQLKNIYVFQTKIFNREIIIYFVSSIQKSFEKEIKFILTWLYILNIYSPKRCVHKLTIYLYFTHLTKQLPNHKSIILDKCHINTAFTYTCPGNAEIVLYRKEEWMKVFIHETFHTFGLDFSNMSQDSIQTFINNHFNIQITPYLFESYTEFWGEIIHILFLSYYFHSENKTLFIQTFYNILTIEINHTLLQVNKIFHHMDLHYLYFFNKTLTIQYKENTPVFSYYIIKSILLFHFNDFIGWCCENNKNNIICFTKNNITLQNYLFFIKKYYKKKIFLEKLNKYYDIIKKIKDPFIQKNLRMTAIEYYL